MGKRFSSFAALVAACTAASCAGRQTPKTRGDAKFDLVKPFTEAAEIEQTRGAKAATAAYLGGRGTPLFFVNQKLVPGAQPFSVFQKLIEEELLAIKTKR